jgi:hypothetical protein
VNYYHYRNCLLNFAARDVGETFFNPRSLLLLLLLLIVLLILLLLLDLRSSCC